MSRHSRIAAICAVLFLSAVTHAAWPDEMQWTKVPPSANAVLVIDVSGAYSSPLGIREGWAKRYSETNHASLGSLPPSVESLLIAGQFDFAQLEPNWQVAIAKGNISLDQV